MKVGNASILLQRSTKHLLHVAFIPTLHASLFTLRMLVIRFNSNSDFCSILPNKQLFHTC
jgi:hypothetical protein